MKFAQQSCNACTPRGRKLLQHGTRRDGEGGESMVLCTRRLVESRKDTWSKCQVPRRTGDQHEPSRRPAVVGQQTLT